MAPASSSELASSASTLHLLGETHEGPLRRLARCFRSRFVQDQSQFFIAVAQLDARDDRLPFLGLQTLERLFVCFYSLAPDCCLQWRVRRFDSDAVEIR